MARKRTIITGAETVTMDAALGDFPSADILIEDGAIAAVGPSLEAGDAERIDAAGMIALPGIIDAHTCLWQTILRGYVPDLWQGTYNTKLLPLRRHYTPEDNFNAAYVGAFEMLSYGTTTVVDYCHDIGGPDHAPHSIEALKTTGIRHLFTYSFMTFEPDTFPDGGAVRGCAPGLRQVPRPERPHHDRLRHRFDRHAASCRAARLLARAEGAELHPCQRDRHDQQAPRGRPARAGLAW